MDAIIPTWGYAASGAAKVFDLKPGEKLPRGWSDKPAPGQHPHEKEAAFVAEPEPEAPMLPPDALPSLPPPDQ